MIKAVLFDFWGTIVEIGVFPSPVKQIRNILGLHRLHYRKYIVLLERALMLDESADLYAAFTKVCEVFQREPTQEILDELVGMRNKNNLLANPLSDTERTLETLRKQYKIALVSNSDCFSVKAVIDKYGMEKFFDEILLSHETGYLKIDREMFEEALKRLGVEPHEAVMVGDSINSDIRSAQRAGVNAILIDRRGRGYHDISYVIENLDELPLAMDELSAEIAHRREIGTQEGPADTGDTLLEEKSPIEDEAPQAPPKELPEEPTKAFPEPIEEEPEPRVRAPRDDDLDFLEEEPEVEEKSVEESPKPKAKKPKAKKKTAKKAVPKKTVKKTAAKKKTAKKPAKKKK